MRIDVQIAPAIINWVISQTQLSELSKEVANNLQAWKNGDKTPTFSQIENASKATGIPLGYFFLQTPPHEDKSLIKCRTIDSVTANNPSRDLMNTIHDMKMIQDWMREQLIADGVDPLDYVGKFKDNAKTVAENTRKILDIDIDWYKKVANNDSFGYFRSAISESGVIVMANGIVGGNTHRPLNVDEFRAFTIIDEYAPLIFINSNDANGAKLFSLLHEFAHVCLGHNSFFNDRNGIGNKVSKIETICNAVAAEIIVPQALFAKEWSGLIKDNTKKQVITKLSSKFKCGTIVVARKALDNGYISSGLYNEVFQLAVKRYNEQRKKKSAGGDYYNTLSSRIDKRFLRKLAASVAEGNTLYEDAYRFTNTNRVTFEKLINQGGGNNG